MLFVFSPTHARAKEAQRVFLRCPLAPRYDARTHGRPRIVLPGADDMRGFRLEPGDWVVIEGCGDADDEQLDWWRQRDPLFFHRVVLDQVYGECAGRDWTRVYRALPDIGPAPTDPVELAEWLLS